MKPISKKSSTIRKVWLIRLGTILVPVFFVSCTGNAESSTTTARCYDANGFPYDSSNPDEVLAKGCWNAQGELNYELSEELSNTTTTTETITTTTEETANWVYGVPSDVFVAPFVQPVCDTLRVWKAPAETTSEEFRRFSQQVTDLKKMIGSPSDPSFSDTYWRILALASEALDFERRHPNDKYPAFTSSYGPKECDRLNFTPDNSRFGVSD